MSGICGIALKHPGLPVGESVLIPMIRALGFGGPGRGPTAWFDSGGLGACECPGYDWGVAHRELHGATVALAFQGRMYNAGELKSAGEADAPLTDVLLALYVREGMRLLDRLRGDFALALWDDRDEALYLATDRFRVEPLFYHEDGNKLVFASRIKGILACPLSIDRSIDPVSLIDVMAFSAVCTPRTIFRSIRKVPPGHVLKYCAGRVTLHAYWDVDFRNPSTASESDLARTLTCVLNDAVSARLESDISYRIGTFLSGGLDSSTVTGILMQAMKEPVKSFSIGFEEQRFNEIDYARIAAQHFGAEHYAYFVKPDDVLDAIPILLDAFDEPFANASAIPTYFCAKLAKQQGRDVLYAGDGGDELFAGNERYSAQRLFEYYSLCPATIRKWMVEPIVWFLADHVGGQFFTYARKYIRRANIPYPERLTSYGLFNIIPMPDLVDPALLEAVDRSYDPYSPIRALYFEAPATAELDRQLYIDLKHALADNDLFKVTRMTHAAGVAVRFPFLDHHLAEFAATVPAAIKMRGRKLRSFYKKAYADFLPEAILTKTKHGFGLPIPVWLRTNRRLNELMQDLVLSARSLQRGYFQKPALEALLQEHRQDRSSFYGTILWNVMILELWHRAHVDESSVSLKGQT